MSSDIISHLQLDKEFTSSRVIVAKEIGGCDSSFIVNCVLGHCIKNNYGVLVVSVHNFPSHYQNVGHKMNYNLQKNMELGLIQFLNVGEENVNLIMMNEDLSIHNIFLGIKEKFLAMKESYSSVNIIIDGISHLFDLNFTLREVNNFCKDIIALVRNYSNSFVLYHCNVTYEDDVSFVLSNLLSHKAYSVVEVESLPSGLSADVSGHLTIKYPGQKFDNEHIFTLDLKPSRYLFKLFDRGVKLFAPGTV